MKMELSVHTWLCQNIFQSCDFTYFCWSTKSHCSSHLVTRFAYNFFQCTDTLTVDVKNKVQIKFFVFFLKNMIFWSKFPLSFFEHRENQSQFTPVIFIMVILFYTYSLSSNLLCKRSIFFQPTLCVVCSVDLLSPVLFVSTLSPFLWILSFSLFLFLADRCLIGWWMLLHYALV